MNVPAIAPANAQANPPAPPPSPPLLENLLCENPWVGIALRGSLALVAWFWRKGRPWATLGLVAACLGLFLLERSITTTREHLNSRTRALVAYIAAGDDEAAAPILAPDARFARRGERSEGIDREAILQRIRTDLRGQYKVRQYSIRDLASSIDGPNVARTRTRVRVTPEAIELPTSTWWTLDWRLDADGQWRVRAITLQAVEGLIQF